MATKEGSYDAATMPGGLDVELERLRDQALLMWGKESRNLRMFGLQDGMDVLEPGAGPGFVTGQLLEMVPKGSVTVVELDPTLIEKARSYLAGKGDDRLRIVEGNIMKMDFPDNSFDFAYGRLLFQHLPDPVGAAREVLRVLRPGGKLVIMDIDDDLHLFHPKPDPEVEAIYNRSQTKQEEKGGSRFIGRRLPRILRDAGFSAVEIEMIVDHSDIRGIDKIFPQQPRELMHDVVDKGLATEEEFEMAMADQERFYSSDPIVILSVFMVCGEKSA